LGGLAAGTAASTATAAASRRTRARGSNAPILAIWATEKHAHCTDVVVELAASSGADQQCDGIWFSGKIAPNL
jgi:hypothetical protein